MKIITYLIGAGIFTALILVPSNRLNKIEEKAPERINILEEKIVAPAPKGVVPPTMTDKLEETAKHSTGFGIIGITSWKPYGFGRPYLVYDKVTNTYTYNGVKVPCPHHFIERPKIIKYPKIVHKKSEVRVSAPTQTRFYKEKISGSTGFSIPEHINGRAYYVVEYNSKENTYNYYLGAGIRFIDEKCDNYVDRVEVQVPGRPKIILYRGKDKEHLTLFKDARLVDNLCIKLREEWNVDETRKFWEKNKNVLEEKQRKLEKHLHKK